MGKKGYNHGYKFQNFTVPDYGKWNLYRDIAKEKLSQAAQLKLEWIIFYHTLGNKNATLTASQFGISRKTLHKWLGRFQEQNLLTLEETTRRPTHTRTWKVTRTEEDRIKTLRKTYMRLGKKKLQVLYHAQFGEPISTWKIERVIRRHQLFPNAVEHRYLVHRREKQTPRIRIHTVKDTLKNIHQFGFLWHMDSIIIWWNGKRTCILTAIEEHTRIAYARVYPNNTATTAEDFLNRLLYVSDNKIRIMHSDNGSEFQGAFEKICKTLGILHIYSRAHTPKDNALLERFNRTIQDEWLALFELGLDDIALANASLTDWLVFYNAQRPHQALDYKTPLQYAHERFFKVLPMYPASTNG